MQLKTSFAAIALVCISASAMGQENPTAPVCDFEPYKLDTGVISNAGARAVTGYANVIHVEDAGWLRLYFSETTLDPGSVIRITSLTDLEIQTLDVAALKMWNNSSAYFNGDTLLFELVAAAGSRNNRVVISEISKQDWTATNRGGAGECGICGGSDDRVQSSESWAARLLPAGCTASVWNEESCMVSAGHCIGGGDVAQFNVPNSNFNCSLNHPPVADQFPIIQEQHVNGGVGNDWAAMVAGTNNQGQTPFDRFGEFRPIGGVPFGNQPLSMWGYGVDNTCTRSQTQQTHSGPVTSVFSTWFEYSIDLRGGNSGSALIGNDTIVGIATHCPCPNVATRMDRSNFVSARNALCPPGPSGDPAALRNLKIKKGTLTSGGVNSLPDSDNNYAIIDSDNSGTNKQVNMTANLRTTILPPSVSRLDVKVEMHLNTVGVPAKIEIRDWAAGGWLLLQNIDVPTADTVYSFENIANPNNYVRSNGNISIRIRPSDRNVAGFTLSVDQVEVLVYD